MLLFESLVNFVDSEIDLLTLVSSHKCDTDKGIFGGHGRGYDRSHKNTCFEEGVSDAERSVVVANKERDDRRFGIAYLEAKLTESVEGIVCNIPKGLLAFGFGAHNMEGGEYRSC